MIVPVHSSPARATVLDVTDRLDGLTVPLLVVGSELMFPSDDSSQHLLEHYGFSKAHSLSFKRMGGTGHFMMLERPAYLASVLMTFTLTVERTFEH